MNKKIIALLLVAVLATSVFALGIGVQGGWVGEYGGGAALTFKPDSAPCVFALDLGFGNNYFYAGLTADWWIMNPTITGPWGWFWGFGVGGGLAILNNEAGNISIGPRVFIGTNVFAADWLEFYLMGGWQPDFVLWLGNYQGNAWFHWFHFPINFGFRFWF